jgi:lysophospholipase L1-like esterase
MSERAPRYRWARRILVLVLLFVAGEVATRVEQYMKMGALPTYKPRHVLDFYRFYRVNPEYRSRTVRVDSAGFRNDEDATAQKPENVVRIITMGGSTVWGEDGAYPPYPAIDNSQTIAAHLERLLNVEATRRQAPFRVQVLNAGVVGYRLYQNLDYFNHRLGEFHPDLVIAMDGHNDLDALILGIPPYHHRNQAPLERALNHPTLFDVFGLGVTYAEQRSLFVRKAHSRLGQMVNGWALQKERSELGRKRRSDVEVEKWLSEYVETVRRLDASARIAGAHVLFAVQPELAGEREKQLTDVEVKMREYWGGGQWLHTEVRDRLIARMHETADRYGIWFEDVSDVFRGTVDQTYVDYTHLNDLGASLMAKRLGKVVEGHVFNSGGFRQPR